MHKPAPNNWEEILCTSNPVIDGTELTLAEAVTAKFTIFNLLGYKIAEHSGSSWQWGGLSASGSKLPNGLYTVEAEGVSIVGKPVHASRNIILMK